MKARVTPQIVLLCLSLLTIVSILSVSCSTPAPTSAPAPAATAAAPKPSAATTTAAPPAGAGQVKAQTWLCNGSVGTATSIDGAAMQEFGRLVEERTGGQIKFKYVWGAGMTKPGEELDALVSRQSDLAYLVVGYWPSKLFLANFFNGEVPFSIQDNVQLQNILEVLTMDERLLDKEYESQGIKFLWADSKPSYSLLSRKPITKLDDFKGMKIAVTGDRFTKMLSAIGAVPLPTTMADRGTALQTGMLDGSIIPNDLTYPYKLHQFAQYHMDMDWGALSSVNFGMTLELFKSQPADVQKILLATAREVARHNAPLYFYNEARLLRLMVQEKVVVNPPLSADEKAKWSNMLGEPVAERVKRGEDQGLPNKALAQRFMDLLTKAGWKFPKQWSVQ